MDIISIVNTMQPETISALALNEADLPTGPASVQFMGYWVQLFAGQNLPTEAAVTAYEPTYTAAIAAAQTATQAFAALPDIPTQLANLTAALISANVIPTTALPSEQITAVNLKLSALNQPNIGSASIVSSVKTIS